MSIDIEKEREAFEKRHSHHDLQREGLDYYCLPTQARWEAWQARAALAATVAPKSQTRIDRLKAAIEGECEGLAISDEHAQAILEYIDEQPAPPQKQPTEEMGRAYMNPSMASWRQRYIAMLDAAPPPPKETEAAQSIMAAIEIYGHMRYRMGCPNSKTMEELSDKCAPMLANLRSQIDAAIAAGGKNG